MNACTRAAVSLLEALGKTDAALASCAADLRSHRGVLSTHHELNLRKYPGTEFFPGHTSLSGYFECELSDGSARDWGFQVTWTPEAFLVSGSINGNDREGPYLIERLSDRRADSIEELILVLDDVVAELRYSATTMSFAA